MQGSQSSATQFSKELLKIKFRITKKGTNKYMSKEKKELLKPKYDIVFQALFEGNKENNDFSNLSIFEY